MRKILDCFNMAVSRITWVLSVIGMIGLVLLSCAVVADVFMRYVFNSPITGVRDLLSLFIAVCVGFMMPVLLLKEGNVAVQFIVVVVGEFFGNIFQIIANIVVAIVFLLMGYEVWKAAAYMGLNNEITQVLGVPLMPWWTIVAICFFFSVIAGLVPIFNGIWKMFHWSEEKAKCGGEAA